MRAACRRPSAGPIGSCSSAIAWRSSLSAKYVRVLARYAGRRAPISKFGRGRRESRFFGLAPRGSRFNLSHSGRLRVHRRDPRRSRRVDIGSCGRWTRCRCWRGGASRRRKSPRSKGCRSTSGSRRSSMPGRGSGSHQGDRRRALVSARELRGHVGARRRAPAGDRRQRRLGRALVDARAGARLPGLVAAVAVEGKVHTLRCGWCVAPQARMTMEVSHG